MRLPRRISSRVRACVIVLAVVAVVGVGAVPASGAAGRSNVALLRSGARSATHRNAGDARLRSGALGATDRNSGSRVGVARLARVPGLATRGARHTVVVTAVNGGASAARRAVVVQLRTLGTRRVHVVGRASVRIGAGGRATVRVHITIPQAAAYGQARIQACVAGGGCSAVGTTFVVPLPVVPSRRPHAAVADVTSALTWRLVGDASSYGVVSIYSDSACTHLVAGAYTQRDASFEAQLALRPDSVNDFFGATTTPVGTSACVQLARVRQDSTAPQTPELAPLPAIGNTPDAELAGPAQDHVRVYAGAGCHGDPVAYGVYARPVRPGTWGTVSAQVHAVAEGDAVFSARAFDDAGNVSPCTAPITYRYDATAPAAPVALGAAAPVDAVAVELYDGNDCAGALLAAAYVTSGAGWDVPVAVDGHPVISMRYRDAAGNVSTCTDVTP